MGLGPLAQNTVLTTAARAGYAARALVYVSTGLVALLAAWELGPAPVGATGALAQWAEWPLGRVWLFAAGASLAAFSMWRAIQAGLDADRLGTDPKALALRAGKGVSAIVHLALAWSAFELLDAAGDLQEDLDAHANAARVLALPFGQMLLLGVAAATLFAGAGNLLKAARPDLGRELVCVGLERRWAVHLGRWGYAARGAAFVLLAAFLSHASWSGDPSDVRSLGGALDALERQPGGSWLLTAVALGFGAFGAYGLVQARYRRIRAPRLDLGLRDVASNAP